MSSRYAEQERSRTPMRPLQSIQEPARKGHRPDGINNRQHRPLVHARGAIVYRIIIIERKPYRDLSSVHFFCPIALLIPYFNSFLPGPMATIVHPLSPIPYSPPTPTPSSCLLECYRAFGSALHQLAERSSACPLLTLLPAMDGQENINNQNTRSFFLLYRGSRKPSKLCYPEWGVLQSPVKPPKPMKIWTTTMI